MKRNCLWGMPLCLNGRKLPTPFTRSFFIILLASVCWIQPLRAQQTSTPGGASLQSDTIRGTVTDSATGQPLEGVTVSLEGSKTRTITGRDGAFSLSNAGRKRAILFTHVSYGSFRVTAETGKPLSIKLAPSAGGLNQVIVVAYGTQKRANVTGAIVTVAAPDLIKNSNNDVTNTLTGRAPGVRVTQLSSQPGVFDSQIDIRGYSTVSSTDILGNEVGGPLFVIDGVPRDKSAFDHLDPNEIQSLSVLKDATAAIYGVKSANGVILVTTKKGGQGATEVSYTAHFGEQFITKYPDLCNAYQYATLYDEQQLNTFISNNQQITTLMYSAQDIADYKSGKLPSTNFLKAIVGNHTSQQQHNINISGGSDKIRFFVSGGYFQEGGLLTSHIEDGKKYNFRAAVTAQLIKGLTLDLNLGFNDALRNGPQTAAWSLVRNAWNISPTETIYSNGDPKYYRQFLNNNNDNPVAQINQNVAGYDNHNDKALTTTFNLNYTIPGVRGLSARALVAYDNNYSFERSFQKSFTQYQFDAGLNAQTPFTHASPSQLTEFFSQGIRNDLQLSLNYVNHFGKNNVSATAIYEQIYNQANGNSAQTQYVIDAIDQLQAGNRATDHVGSSYSQNTSRSYAGKANYDYAGKYLLEAGFREDGSSYFPPNSRWGFFPYGSVGWRISEEPFIKDYVNFIDNLKIRGTYGKTGDDAAAAAGFPAFSTGYIYPGTGGSVFGSGIVSGVDFRNSVDANITWYTATASDIGLEASFWNGKLSFEGDVFRRDRDGLLATPIQAIPGTYGVNLPQINLNSDRTQGFEIVLGHRSRIGQVSYNISANMSYARTQWRHYEQSAPTNASDNYNYANHVTGRYVDELWGYKVLGQFKDYQEIHSSPDQDGAANRSLLPGDLKYEDKNGDGIIDTRDYQVIGHGGAKPAIYFGANFEASWKGIDFSMLLQGATMYDITYQDQLSRPFYFQTSDPISAFYDRWHRADLMDPNSAWIPGKYPSTGQRQNYKDNDINSFNTFNGTYLRIKSLELGYSFQRRTLGKTGIHKIRIFGNAYNLFTFTGKRLNFVDPEYTDTRLYSYNYPITKNVNIGAQITF